MGCIYKRGKTWWLKYVDHGVAKYESSGSTKHADARDLLKVREAAVVRGEPIVPRADRLTFDQAAADLEKDYEANRRRTLPELQYRLRLHLLPFFRGRRLATLSATDARAYAAGRLSEGAKPATVNRELAIVKRVFTLAAESGKVLHRPVIPMLREANTRTGFVDADRFASIVRELSPPLQAPVRFAYATGWRLRSEVLPLQWRNVDLAAGVVRLEPGATKSGDGRTFPLTLDLRALLEVQRRLTDEVQRGRSIIVPHVFHRDGAAIRYMKKAWAGACRRAGSPGLVPHDLRRSAVRNMLRAGINEKVAMVLCGWRTRSVLDRYHIIAEADLHEAAKKLSTTG